MLKSTILCLVIAGTLFGAAASSAGAKAPVALTQNGRDLYQFEALLNDTFHSAHVSAHNLNFACVGSSCLPSAYWQTYLFTFVSAHGSSFHRSNQTFAPRAFGNFPTLVRIQGKAIACDIGEHRFLIAYGGAVGFGLACLAP